MHAICGWLHAREVIRVGDVNELSNYRTIPEIRETILENRAIVHIGIVLLSLYI